MSEAQLAHRRLVQSLYKRSLKTAQDWYIDTNLFRRKAVELRMQFEAGRSLTHPRQIAQAVQDAERQLIEFRHPDPYIGKDSYTGHTTHESEREKRENSSAPKETTGWDNGLVSSITKEKDTLN